MNELHAFERARDRGLVKQAQAGDQAALTELVRIYERKCDYLASLVYWDGAQHEDIVQEARVGLLRAVDDFDGKDDRSFRSFADLCIRRWLITQMKHAGREKRQALAESVREIEMEGDRVDVGSFVADPVDGFEQAERLAALHEIGSRALTFSTLERHAFEGYLNGQSYAEMAIELGTNEKSIDNAFARVRAKLADLREAA